MANSRYSARPTPIIVTGRGNFVERLIAWGGKAIMEIMIASRLQPLRPRHIAQAAVAAAAALPPGVHVIGARDIAALVAPADSRHAPGARR